MFLSFVRIELEISFYMLLLPSGFFFYNFYLGTNNILFYYVYTYTIVWTTFIVL